MRKVLAVSGGVDSMLLLHLFRADPEPPVVAHFNHGIRPNSDEDCDFVRRVATEYGLEFVSQKMTLGASCSEEKARLARYDFLFSVARKYNARLYTAHHADDLLESMIINLLRGTGWRGLTPLRDARIERPLLSWSRADILRYAAEHKLSFREDQTNSDESYLRNRVRAFLCNSDPTLRADFSAKMRAIYERQSIIVPEIESLLRELCLAKRQSLHSYKKSLIDCDETIALELLRFLLAEQGISQTRPQLKRCLLALKKLAPTKIISLDKNSNILVGKYSFSIEKN